MHVLLDRMPALWATWLYCHLKSTVVGRLPSSVSNCCLKSPSFVLSLILEWQTDSNVRLMAPESWYPVSWNPYHGTENHGATSVARGQMWISEMESSIHTSRYAVIQVQHDLTQHQDSTDDVTIKVSPTCQQPVSWYLYSLFHPLAHSLNITRSYIFA